ncbi:hypothetical protein AB0F03_31060 [Streptomyces sp. NPDC028722]
MPSPAPVSAAGHQLTDDRQQQAVNHLFTLLLAFLSERNAT